METITSAELAAKLDGHNTEDKFTRYVIKLAKDSDLVIVSCVGNDTVVFNGAMTEDFDLFRGGKIFMDKDGLAYTKQCVNKRRKPIEAFWEEYKLYTWKFLTLIPHEKYVIKKNSKNWCQGIIFSMNDV